MDTSFPITIKHKKTIFLRLFIYLLIVTPFVFYKMYSSFSRESYVFLALYIFLGLIVLLSVFTNLTKFLQKKPALVMTKEGIQDNISRGKYSLIKWTDIKSIEHTSYVGTKYYILHVHNPQDYIDQTTGMIHKMVTRLFEDKGSPIAIDPRLLEYDKNALLEIWNRNISQ